MQKIVVVTNVMDRDGDCALMLYSLASCLVAANVEFPHSKIAI